MQGKIFNQYTSRRQALAIIGRGGIGACRKRCHGQGYHRTPSDLELTPEIRDLGLQGKELLLGAAERAAVARVRGGCFIKKLDRARRL